MHGKLARDHLARKEERFLSIVRLRVIEIAGGGDYPTLAGPTTMRLP
ncbi:MAG: hypothetical protein ABR501_04720 [Pyrinomonadaceae bacterium]